MQIDRDKCGVCFGCACVCPWDALRATEAEIIIDNDKCTNCGICEKICPVEAIKIES